MRLRNAERPLPLDHRMRRPLLAQQGCTYFFASLSGAVKTSASIAS